MRGVIARRMHESLHEMAQLTIGMEVAMDAATDLRRHLVAEWETEGVKVTYTDLVNRAAVKALALHPVLNASVGDDAIALHPGVHLGLAVALTGGLVVPVVRYADGLDLRTLAAEAARLAAAARDGTLGLDDMAGSTFTVTSLGASGVDFFTPIINAPNVAILGIGRIHDGVAWDGDRPLRRQVMTLSLTFDHRAVDGAPAAAFLASVRDFLEQPYRLLI
jgi:pyruvate/2-oxoglutarate dehydrogenase complex dihydrolipoamide acyltransferase (E2) component